MKIFTKYYATWCIPCKRMSPIVEELAKEMKDVEFIEKDIDEYKAEVKELGISGVPTFVVFEDGNEIARRSGMMSKEDLKGMINEGTV